MYKGSVYMNLFYVPVPNQPGLSNYKNSILSCLTYEHEHLSNILGIDELTGLWGFTPGESNDREYNKTKVGDVIFFRINVDIDGKKYQAFDGFGYISAKLTDISIAKKVWGKSSYGEHLLIINKYYRFYEPFLLSTNNTIVASINDISKEIWHEGYNMFRQWNMVEDTAKWLIDYFSDEDLTLNIYNSHAKISVNTDNTTPVKSDDRETETTVMRTERKGQERFRKDLLSHTDKCEICGINNQKLLVASHIKPWKHSNNMQRLDINNGLALCAIHDKLFDTGLISFLDNGNILLSPDLSKKDKEILKLPLKIRINLNECKKQYMKWHRVKHNYEEVK